MMAVDLLLKSVAIFVIGLGAGAAWPRAAAADRHRVWTWTLAGLLLLPVLSGVLPRWELPLYPRSAHEPIVEIRQMEGAGMSPETAVVISGSDGTFASDAIAASGTRALDLERALFLVWALVALAFLGRWLLAVRHGRALVRRARIVDDLRIRRLARTAGREIGLDRGIRLRCSGEITVPMVAGIVEPFLLLPEDAAGWSDERLRVVLLHELGHVRRRDVGGRAIAALALAVYWFHPGVWLLSRMSDRARERACDDLVLLGGSVPPARYAGHLLAIARRAVARPLPKAGLAISDGTSSLRERVRAILDPRRSRRPMARGPVGLALACAALLVAGVAAAGPPGSSASPRAKVGSSLALQQGVPWSVARREGSVDASIARQEPETSPIEATPTKRQKPVGALLDRIRRSFEDATSAAWGSMYVDSPTEIEKKRTVLEKWMEGGSAAIAERLRELLARPGGDFYLHLRGGRVDHVVLRPVPGPRAHLLIRARGGITGSLTGTWRDDIEGVNLFWLRGVNQATLEVDVPEGFETVTIVDGRRDVVVARPFEGTGIVRVDLR